MQSIVSLSPTNLASTDQAYTGCIYVHPSVFQRLAQMSQSSQLVYGIINQMIFQFLPSDKFADHQIAIGKMHRQILKISLTDQVQVRAYAIPRDREFRLSQVSCELELLQASSNKVEIDDKIIQEIIRKQYKDIIFQNGNQFLIDFSGNTLSFRITGTQLFDLGSAKQQNTQGQPGKITAETDIEISAKSSPNFKLKSSSNKVQNIFRPDFKFEDMGVGGLDQQLSDIFRRAFASRRFPPAVLQKYGISHIKGVLLYGPPGTGKTLIARQLAQVLRSKPPKIVNGPEIMSKYVGESEKNIRDLFGEAISDQKEYGEDSQLHIIIFDEIDAICKQRGSVNSGTGVHDSMVNQLLSMIDGVDSLNNVLVIGMTNRKDMIDEAMLRPGRFEVHIEVSLPDEKGRQDIYKIHTSKMRENGLLSQNVDFSQLSKLSKNYTGAEIEAVVKSARSFGFTRGTNLLDFSKNAVINDNCKIEMEDFMMALEEVKPQFGIDSDKFELLIRNQIHDFGPRFQRIQNLIKDAISQVRSGKSSQLNSILLEGPIGSGKTAIASWTALNCDFPFVKLISPDNYVGYTEQGKLNAIVKVFEDAYRSPQACIVLDNIERLIEFVDIGPRFSNTILQALLILIKKVPQKKNDNRLLIVGTTSQARILKDLEVVQAFNLCINVPSLDKPEEIFAILKQFPGQQSELQRIAQSINKISVKQLIMIIDMATHSTGQLTYEEFHRCYDAITSSTMFDY